MVGDGNDDGKWCDGSVVLGDGKKVVSHRQKDFEDGGGGVLIKGLVKWPRVGIGAVI